MRSGNRVDLGRGGNEVGTREPLEQRIAPLIQRQRILREDQFCYVAQQDRGIVEVAQASQPDFLLGGLGILDQVSEQRFGQFGRVVLGGRLQRMEQGGHRCCTARLLQGGNRGGFAHAGDPCQPFQAGRQHAPGRRWTQVEGTDGFEHVEVQEKFAEGALRRHGPQLVQGGEAGRAGLVE